MPGSKHPLSLFSQALDRVASVAYFLGAVVPLIALGVVVERYALSPYTGPQDEYSSLGLVGMLVSICGLSMCCFLMLRRVTRQALQRMRRDKERLAALLSVSTRLAGAQRSKEVTAIAARSALGLTSARAAFVLLRSEEEKTLTLDEGAGHGAPSLYEALERPLLEMAELVVSEGRPAIHGAPGRGSAAGAGGLGAAVVAPLPSQSVPLGVLAVIQGDARQRFDAAQVNVISTLAGLTSVALRDARTHETNRALAYYDSLTGLPNRRLYKDRLEQALLHARRRGRKVATCFLDLDGFKRVNDTLGHSQGDRLLCEAAQRIVGGLRSGDSVARLASDEPGPDISRLGGDEFTFLLRDLPDPQSASAVAWRILEGLRRPFDLEGQEVYVTASIGIALFPDDGDDAETLLRNADTAMYWAKGCGRNNYQFYTKSMNAAARRKLQIEQRLRGALERQEFSLRYQPLRDARSGRLSGAEALLRWEDPEWGQVSPAEFIPVAEETSLILSIGEWVFQTACAHRQAWGEAGFGDLRVAVNISGNQLRQPSLVAKVAKALETSRLSPEHLELEITESTIMQDDEVTVTAFQRLHELGVGLALDDFGTGYSSLSYLRRFPLDRVKIDRSFVGKVHENADDASLTSAIIAMAHGLRLRVVGEGVETREQAELLKAQGCDELQGYLYSPPVTEEEFLRMLRSEGAAPAPGDDGPASDA